MVHGQNYRKHRNTLQNTIHVVFVYLCYKELLLSIRSVGDSGGVPTELGIYSLGLDRVRLKLVKYRDGSLSLVIKMQVY